mgnify:CR=1 FL=1
MQDTNLYLDLLTDNYCVVKKCGDGHVQEIIVQNFRAKADTKMANAPEPSTEELLWTIAVARLIFGPEMSTEKRKAALSGGFFRIVVLK